GGAVRRPVTFAEVFATLYHNLGLDLNASPLADLNGRPQPLVEDGRDRSPDWFERRPGVESCFFRQPEDMPCACRTPGSWWPRWSFAPPHCPPMIRTASRWAGNPTGPSSCRRTSCCGRPASS